MNREQLKTLCALEGISGREGAVRAYLQQQLRDLPTVESMTVDPLGNLIVRVKGQQRAARSVLFSAHIDEVGLIVTDVTDDGYLAVAAVGGVDEAVVFGHTVRVNGHVGVIGSKAIHQCEGDDRKKVPGIDAMLVDIGAADREQALAIAQPGDAVLFDSEWTDLGDDLCKAKALDDRAGCLLLLELIRRQPKYDLTVSFVTQEEIGLRGATVAGYTVQPDIAVVVETTTAADLAGVSGARQVCRVGAGPVVSFMDRRTLYDEELYHRIRTLGDEAGIPTQTKTMVAGGNDAGALQQAAGGVRVAAVSLPCRYLHSPACVLSWKDMQDTAALLALLADTLPEDA